MKLKIDPFTYKVTSSDFTHADAVDTDLMIAITLREIIRGYINRARDLQEIEPPVREVLSLLNKAIDDDRKFLRQALTKLAPIAETLWI